MAITGVCAGFRPADQAPDELKNPAGESPPGFFIGMIPKKPASDVIRGGNRSSEKIMAKQLIATASARPGGATASNRA
jgi:hypothetical protein